MLVVPQRRAGTEVPRPLWYEIAGGSSHGASFWDDLGLDGICPQREEICYWLYSWGGELTGVKPSPGRDGDEALPVYSG